MVILVSILDVIGNEMEVIFTDTYNLESTGHDSIYCFRAFKELDAIHNVWKNKSERMCKLNDKFIINTLVSSMVVLAQLWYDSHVSLDLMKTFQFF